MHVHSLLPILGLTLVSVSGVHASAHPNYKRDLTVSNTLPEKWSYKGCYTDTRADRTLNLDGYSADDMTEGKCIGYCDQKGYSWAGVEYSRECYCGYQPSASATKTAESECNMPCAGASAEPCGGPDRINIFTNGVSPPAENPGVNGWESLGCYSDSQSARTLAEFEPTSDGIVLVRSCVNICQNKGFSYAGLEYGRECFCGNTIRSPATPISKSSCNMPCNGNRTETCGGSNAINIYRFASAPSCTSSAGSGGFVSNPGFESGISPWSTRYISGAGSADVDTSGIAYQGCSTLNFSPTSSGFMQFQFSQTLSQPLVSGQQYTLSFYQGRKSATSGTSDDSIVISGTVGSQRWGQVSGCTGTGCGISGQGGSVYSRYSATFPASASGSSVLTIVVTLQGSGAHAPVLFDEISLVPAS